MNRNELEKALREAHADVIKPKRIRPIKLPTSLGFVGDRSRITITIPDASLTVNMQANAGAFDAWALALRSWLGVKSVTICWKRPSAFTQDEQLHYHRFLYRAERFYERFSEWCHLDSNDLTTPFYNRFKGPFLLNIGDRDKSIAVPHKPLASLSEHELEHALVYRQDLSDVFRHLLRLKVLGNQLPVGVFHSAEVSDKTRVFNGGSSAIDLWGVDVSNRAVIFELKKKLKDSPKVGGLSELFFYAMVMKDLQAGVLKFKTTKGQGSAPYEQLMGTSGLNAVLLAFEFHPLLDPHKHGVIEMLNEASTNNIAFERMLITAKGDFEVVKS